MGRRRKKQTTYYKYIGGAVSALACVATIVTTQLKESHVMEAQTQVEQTVATVTTAEPITHAAEAAGKAGKATKTRSRGYEIPAYLTDREEEIVEHHGFTLSYNSRHLLPNWVAWVLTPERLRGGEKRADNFQPDESIQRGPIATTYDYRGSGYDRGHMCPAADNKHSREAMNDCFLMSNMCPQTHDLNAGDWEQLESRCRSWARRYGELYIVAGPVIKKGGRYEKIGENRVSVPHQFYKVLLRMKSEKEAEAIGFIFNNNDDNKPLESYACSVDEVEALTGINFFSKLPKRVEQKAEATYDYRNW